MGALAPSFNLIGPGRVGQTLTRLWIERWLVTLNGVRARSQSKADAAVLALGAGKPYAQWEAWPATDITLIATRDDEIEDVANALAILDQVWQGAIVFHCSGAHGSTLLSSLSARGAHVASAHPAASFPILDATSRQTNPLDGAYCVLEGDPIAVAALHNLFTKVGARPVEIDTGKKLLYHAGAVLSSNYVVALLAVALDAFGAAGLDDASARALMRPLVDGTLANLWSRAPIDALSGPIQRGDMELVRNQYRALHEADPAIAEVYRAMAVATARLAGLTDPLAGEG